MIAPRIADIKSAVCVYYKITPADLVSRRRGTAPRPRQIAMYLAATLTARSLPEIGAAFKRDHTTVLHARRVVAARLETDSRLRGDVETLRQVVLSAIAPPDATECLAARLVLATAAVFRPAGLALVARSPADAIRLIGPIAVAFGVPLPAERPR